METNDPIVKTATNHLRNFLLAHSERVVSTLHFISPEEFNLAPHRLGKGVWSVLGAS